MSQTTMLTDPLIARQGMKADSRIKSHVASRLVDDASGVKSGLAVVRKAAPESTPGGSPGTVAGMAASPAIGVDADAIAATIASAGTAQTLSGASLDGAVGDAVMVPSRKVSLTLSNHADWDATTAIVTGMDANGELITESLSIPDTGNATVSGTKAFARVLSLYIPAQSGAGGTATLGIQAGGEDLGPYQLAGIALYEPTVESAGDGSAEFLDEQDVPVLQAGGVYVTAEDTPTPDDPVYCRVTAAGAEEAGAFRTDSDSGDAFPVRGMRWARSGALNVLEFDWV